MFEFLAERDPFHLDAVLISLNSGEVTDKSVNVFQAQAIGESLIQSIAATSTFYYKFRKKDMTIIIKTNACVNIEDRVVEIDPRFLLFSFNRKKPMMLLVMSFAKGQDHCLTRRF